MTDPILVTSNYGSNQSYLVITPKTNGGIEVRPTNGHGRSLNRFWPVWLRDCVQASMHERHSVGVALFDHDRQRVAITASRISNSGLAASVAGIAAEVRPLLDPPLKRSRNPRPEIGAGQIAEWAIKTNHIDTLDWNGLLASISWPRVELDWNLEYGPDWYKQRPARTIRMKYVRKRPSQPRLWVMADQLELYCALAAVRQ